MSISKKRLKEIEAIKDKDIDYSDIPEADESFWRRAELHMPEPKKGIYVRLDPDVIKWLKSKGKGYQTRMNAMLRTLMESERRTR
ncbi:MAG: BrnA antitoxin family protein [Acidobacteriota bacterium]